MESSPSKYPQPGLAAFGSLSSVLLPCPARSSPFLPNPTHHGGGASGPLGPRSPPAEGAPQREPHGDVVPLVRAPTEPRLEHPDRPKTEL